MSVWTGKLEPAKRPASSLSPWVSAFPLPGAPRVIPGFSRRLPDGAVLRALGPAVEGKRVCWGGAGCPLPSRLPSIQPDRPPTRSLDGRRVPPAKRAGSGGDGRCGMREGTVSRPLPRRPPRLDPRRATRVEQPNRPVGHFCPCPAAEERALPLPFGVGTAHRASCLDTAFFFFFCKSSAATEAGQSPPAASRGDGAAR